MAERTVVARSRGNPKPERQAEVAANTRPLTWRVLWFCTRWAWHVLAVYGLTHAAFVTMFVVVHVVSSSMAPTLQGTDWKNGDVVLVEKVSYWFRQPRRWDIVTIREPDDGSLVVKRIVGLPGESIQMPRRGAIAIDGKEIEVPSSLSFLNHLPFGNVTAGATFDCGEGYYVLGDDSVDSDDSRFNGSVEVANIIGRAWLIIAPRERFGKVYQ